MEAGRVRVRCVAAARDGTKVIQLRDRWIAGLNLSVRVVNSPARKRPEKARHEAAVMMVWRGSTWGWR